MGFTRREFLRSSTLAAAATIAPPAWSQPPRRVLIAGAGPAGLSAAYDLAQAGVDVQVFEASGRAGGRMYTLREPFSGGLYAEAGAQGLIDTNPGIAYARELGLDLLPFPFDPTLGSLSYFNGARIEHRPDGTGRLPFDLDPDEQGLTVGQLHGRYRRGPIAQIEGLARLAPPALPPAEFEHLDHTSLLDFWRERGASDAAIEVMMHLYVRAYADTPDQINVLQLAREMASMAGVRGAFSVAGGNDGICRELARRLGDRVHYGHPVRAVQQEASGITFRVETSTGIDAVTGDVAILTPPPPVLQTIDFEPALPEATARALRAAIAIPVTLTYAQTRSRFWLEDRLDGNALTDLPVAQISHSTAMQPGDMGILSSMTYGGQAAAMARRSPDERQTQLRDALARLYPGTADLADEGASYAWGDDPWHRSAHVAFRPGTYTEAVGALRQPQGRLFFSGDTMGGVPGYSHAAFGSGQEVARAILASA